MAYSLCFVWPLFLFEKASRCNQFPKQFHKALLEEVSLRENMQNRQDGRLGLRRMQKNLGVRIVRNGTWPEKNSWYASMELLVGQFLQWLLP